VMVSTEKMSPPRAEAARQQTRAIRSKEI
jgi:hypothetical protein